MAVSSESLTIFESHTERKVVRLGVNLVTLKSFLLSSDLQVSLEENLFSKNILRTSYKSFDDLNAHFAHYLLTIPIQEIFYIHP